MLVPAPRARAPGGAHLGAMPSPGRRLAVQPATWAWPNQKAESVIGRRIPIVTFGQSLTAYSVPRPLIALPSVTRISIGCVRSAAQRVTNVAAQDSSPDLPCHSVHADFYAFRQLASVGPSDEISDDSNRIQFSANQNRFNNLDADRWKWFLIAKIQNGPIQLFPVGTRPRRFQYIEIYESCV